MNVFKDKTNFEQILDSCLVRLQSGESIDQCLVDYPDSKRELRPLLMTATAVQDAPLPAARPQAVAQGEARMLAALAEREREAAVSFGTLRRYAERILSVLKQEEASQMRVALRSIVTTVLILFVMGFFALAISANSLPGEPFYPVKLGWESIRVGLTFDEAARQQLEAQIQQNRRQELAALIELGRQTQIVYEGFVEQIEDDQLIVDGFYFETNLETQWLIEPEVGDAVRIDTEITAEGKLVALEISAGSLDPQPHVVVTPTPCNTPACLPPTSTPTPCNAGACGNTATPPPTETAGPTPTPCNSPACASPTATSTPCNAGACETATPTPVPSDTPDGPTPTPCNTPSCPPPTATPTPCNAGACGNTPTPPPPSTPGNPTPTPTPCNTPSCAPPTSTPTPCQVGCGDPSPTPVPSSTPGNPTPTPCNTPSCAPPTPTPTPCQVGACGDPSPTPLPTNTPGNPTPTPCNSPACTTPSPTPTVCSGGICGGPSPTPVPTNTPGHPSPTPCNTPGCSNPSAIPPSETG